jgi:dihydroneopterin aldolase
MGTIKIENMSFYSYHGCFEEESLIGTHFSVDLEFDYDSKKAEYSDKIEDTINYLEVYQRVKAEMDHPSHLLEHLARRILERMAADFPITKCKLKVTKINPPLGGQIGGVSVTLCL